MNVSQNISAIFNSPEIAAVALQAVQAGELAERQTAIVRQREEMRREHQVTGAQEAGNLDSVEPHASDRPASDPRRAGRRVRTADTGKTPEASEASPAEPEPAPGDGHRIDLRA